MPDPDATVPVETLCEAKGGLEEEETMEENMEYMCDFVNAREMSNVTNVFRLTYTSLLRRPNRFIYTASFMSRTNFGLALRKKENKL